MSKKEYPAKLTTGYYRVREVWEDEASQFGAYRLLANAKAKCDENPGSRVFDNDGNVIYPEEAVPDTGADENEEKAVVDDIPEDKPETTTPVEDTPAENEATQETENSGAADESAPAAEEPQQNDTEGTKNETDAQMEIEALPAESPKLYLNTYEVTVEAGNDLDKTSYIKEMTDDADSQESLFNQIEIDGDVDTAVPGDYMLTYHVTDSDGNRSNAAVLTVHVQ